MTTPNKKDTLRLGVIGLSEGNGHPFSWSAIVNGEYDREVMAACGYPVIPQYLGANADLLGVDGARVTAVWTQDRELSAKIARATNIDSVAERMEDLIGRVDAVLLTRDDPENHVAMARPFLEAGIPIFIDKPLAITLEDLDFFRRHHAAGKLLMSCSSMRYSTELRAVKSELAALGRIELVTAVGKKDWIKYGVHMLEAVFALLDDPKATAVRHTGESHRDVVQVEFDGGPAVSMHLFYDIVPTFQISVFGTQGWRLIEMKNYFEMFRHNLSEFVRSVREGRSRLEFARTENIVRTLIAANESLQRGGEKINIE
jgi:predicted dehydrogenase